MRWQADGDGHLLPPSGLLRRLRLRLLRDLDDALAIVVATIERRRP